MLDTLGHRGCVDLAPENTLCAFERAAAVGVDGVEFDVRATADGTPVLLHDETVDRTTDGTGRLADLPLAEVRALDAGGEPVPTLSAALSFVEAAGVDPWIEVKEPGVAPDVAAAVRDRDLSDRAVVLSGHAAALDAAGAAGLRTAIPVAAARDGHYDHADPFSAAAALDLDALLFTCDDVGPDLMAGLSAVDLGAGLLLDF